MKAVGLGLLVIGYALLYSGASNLFTGGQGWGFLQSLLNKGEENNSGSVGGGLTSGGSKGSSGGDSGGGSSLGTDALKGLGKLFNGIGNLTGGIF